MNIQVKKTELVKILSDTKKTRIFKQVNTADFCNDLSIEQRKEIETASREIENGKITDYRSFM